MHARDGLMRDCGAVCAARVSVLPSCRAILRELRLKREGAETVGTERGLGERRVRP